MCNRYSLANVAGLHRLLRELGLTAPEELVARYNIPLTARVPVVKHEGGTTTLEPLSFGALLPAREPGERPMLVGNARAENLSRGAFKEAAEHRRCLVPADGFFEWEHAGRARLPHYFYRRDREPFFFAGLWRAESTTTPASVVIVTTTPNELLAPIHDRMPVMLGHGRIVEWLGDTPLPPDRLKALCTPFPAPEMASHRVDPRMNNARHEGADCILPWSPPPPEPTLFD
jgi:putative SOS response-associated peptidase YedK